MKVLLWGIDSPWTLNFVKNFLLKSKYEVWILNRRDKKESEKYNKVYKEYGVHLIEFPSAVTDAFDKKYDNFFSSFHIRFLLLKTIMKSGPFDVINMQYVDYSDLMDVVILKFLLHSKLILSYWGSDLLRTEESRLNSAEKLLKYADFVTFDNADLELKFKEIYTWADVIPKRTVMLGLPVLDIIKKCSSDNFREEIRERWGISKEKVVIGIGYNGIPAQQHKKVLSVLEKLDDNYKKRIVLLLQMSYGGIKTYRNSVISAAERTGIQYIDIQHFLTDDEVSRLRILTDIFINAQATDAFSGSVCEYLFAGTILINARWLRYKEFETYDFNYREFDDFNEINHLIEEAMTEKINTEKNAELIWKLRSWECCSPKWKTIYKRMCNHGKNSSYFGRRKGDKTPPVYRGNTETSGSHSR